MPEHEVVWQTRDRHHATRRGSERHTDDRELLARLQDARFEGPLLEQLVNDLWQYGWRCLRRWMRDGTITAQCKAKGIPLTCFNSETTELQRSSELREDLAATAVGDAVRYFVETSLPCGYWKPHKGASMRTYFKPRPYLAVKAVPCLRNLPEPPLPRLTCQSECLVNCPLSDIEEMTDLVRIGEDVHDLLVMRKSLLELQVRRP